MEILDNLKRFFVGLLMIGVLSSVLFSKMGFVFAGPPLSGDWVVTGTESYYDEEIVLNGNLIVEDGGNLTFRKVTLKMNCTYDGQYNIEVKHGGRFYVLDDSVITSVDPEKEYLFQIENGSIFRMRDSELHECGIDDGGSGLSIGSNDVVIENNLISNNWYGIICHSSNPVIRDNNISSNRWEGILLYNSNATIEANYMKNNGAGIRCDDYSSPVIQGNVIVQNGIGIHAYYYSNPIIKDNIITANDGDGITLRNYSSPIICNNHISLNNRRGIDASTASPTIRNNTITKNEDGVLFWNEAEENLTIQDNIITLNYGYGIVGAGNCNPVIQGNNITSNRIMGIHLKHGIEGIIQGNIITNNSGEGIGFGGGIPSLIIQGNTITSNRGIGIWCDDFTQAEVHWNDIYDNDQDNIRNDDPWRTANATYNYWGYWDDGPEKISGNVLYNPWLTESIVPFAPEITSPLQGEIVSSPATVSTEVDAPNGVHKVEFYIDDQLEYTDYDASYEWNWDTTQHTETEHKITAKAHDTFGLKTSASITVFVDNTAPTVSIKEPTPENTYCGIISVSVNATDNKELGNVHVKVDDFEWFVMTYNPTDFLWKYGFDTTILSDGEHTLMVLVLDKASNPATTSTTLLTDNTPPTLTIQAPQGGITVGLTLVVKVQASDAAGVSRVEFYLQDVLVCTLYEAPYQWSWDTTKYPNGEYTITTKAYDTIGNMETSETTLTVQNVESPWWQTHALTIVEVVIATAGLTLGILTYLTRKREIRRKKKKKK